MNTRTFSLLLSLILVWGCEATPHYNRLQVATFNMSGPITKKPYGSTVPFETPEDVKQPYEVVGYMSCEGSVSDEGSILKAMLYRAADMGADGIILNPKRISTEQAASGQNINVKWGWMAMIGNGNNCAFRAQAIRFTAK